MSLPSVAIVGINGWVASHVIDGLTSPLYKSKIAFPIHLVTRDVAKTAALPVVAASPSSFKLFKGDIATGEGLAEAFAGVTVVVDAVGAFGSSHRQIVDAAAGSPSVKVYVPSEFGFQTTPDVLGKYYAAFEPKLIDINYARTKAFKTVSIYTGMFSEFLFGVPSLGGFSTDTQFTAYAPDAQYALTSLPDIGRTVAAVVSKGNTPEVLPDRLKLKGDTINGKRAVEIYEKVTGKKVDFKTEPGTTVTVPADKIVAAGHPESLFAFLDVLKAVFSQGYGDVEANYKLVVGDDFKFENAEEAAIRLLK